LSSPRNPSRHASPASEFDDESTRMHDPMQLDAPIRLGELPNLPKAGKALVSSFEVEEDAEKTNFLDADKIRAALASRPATAAAPAARAHVDDESTQFFEGPTAASVQVTPAASASRPAARPAARSFPERGAIGDSGRSLDRGSSPALGGGASGSRSRAPQKMPAKASTLLPATPSFGFGSDENESTIMFDGDDALQKLREQQKNAALPNLSYQDELRKKHGGATTSEFLGVLPEVGKTEEVDAVDLLAKTDANKPVQSAAKSRVAVSAIGMGKKAEPAFPVRPTGGDAAQGGSKAANSGAVAVKVGSSALPTTPASSLPAAVQPAFPAHAFPGAGGQVAFGQGFSGTSAPNAFPPPGAPPGQTGHGPFTTPQVSHTSGGTLGAVVSGGPQQVQSASKRLSPMIWIGACAASLILVVGATFAVSAKRSAAAAVAAVADSARADSKKTDDKKTDEKTPETKASDAKTGEAKAEAKPSGEVLPGASASASASASTAAADKPASEPEKVATADKAGDKSTSKTTASGADAKTNTGKAVGGEPKSAKKPHEVSPGGGGGAARPPTAPKDPPKELPKKPDPPAKDPPKKPTSTSSAVDDQLKQSL
jgi:hypothetical protein